MKRITRLLSGLLLLLPIAILAQQDTVLYQRDSTVIPETDPTTLFFQQNEKAATPSKLMLVTKARKTISLASFLKSPGQHADHALADLDGDGKKELLLYNFTGGAHCCDEIYVFRNTGLNRYQHAVKLFAGNTVIIPEKDFVYNFHEQFGYFFTCFACSYSDTTDAAPIPMQNILLRYNKGKMQVVAPDKELRSVINDNLGKLGEQPYEKLEDATSFDNGLRKEFALNLAVFYYSYGRSLAETQKLFNKYYQFPDAKKVWTSFVSTLNAIRKQSDF